MLSLRAQARLLNQRLASVFYRVLCVIGLGVMLSACVGDVSSTNSSSEASSLASSSSSIAQASSAPAFSSQSSSSELSSLDSSSFDPSSSQPSSSTPSSRSSIASASSSVAPVSNQAPEVSITAPDDGGFLPYGSSIDVTAWAVDRDGTIVSVTLYLNDQVVAVDEIAPYGWAASNLPVLSGLAEGLYTLRAIARDNQGAISEAELSFEVSEPNDFPQIVVQVPAAELDLPVGSTVDIFAAASDADGSIEEVRLYLDGELLKTDSNSPYEWYGSGTAKLRNLEAGSYTYVLQAEDDKGAITEKDIIVRVSANTFEGAGDPSRGALQYFQQCIDCHGQFGEGNGGRPNLLPLKEIYNGQLLYEYIESTMPSSFPASCEEQCARNIASFLTQSLQSKADARNRLEGNAAAGAESYEVLCADCHGEKALGGTEDVVLFPLRSTYDYRVSTFYYSTSTANLFATIDLSMPLGPRGYPEGYADLCEGQCTADVMAYLGVLEGQLTPAEQKQVQIATGKRYYQSMCSGCHREDGTRSGIIPLNNRQRTNDTLDDNDPLFVENRDRMPPSMPSDCDADCARDVSVYIREVLDR